MDWLADAGETEPRRAGAEEAARLRAQAAARGYRCIRIEGGRAADKAALMEAFARAVPLPDYFGRNWDALEECLREPEVLGEAPGLLVEVEAFSSFEKGLGGEASVFLALMRDLCADWAGRTPPAFFKTLLVD